MHSVVLTKGVPDFREGVVSFDDEGHLERGKTPTVMNPNDAFALEAALQTKIKHGGTVSAMSMGPPGYASVLQEAMEVYADDLYLLSDREMAAADTWATAITLATAIEKLGEPDLVLAGFKTADGETGQTGPQTAWALDRPIITHVIDLEVLEDENKVRAKRLVAGDISEVEIVESPLPAFVVTDPEFDPSYRRAEHRLKLKDLEAETRERAAEYEDYLTTWDHQDLNLDPDYIGLDGSPTIVSSVDPIPKAPAERDVTYVESPDSEEYEAVFDTVAEFAGGD